MDDKDQSYDFVDDDAPIAQRRALDRILHQFHIPDLTCRWAALEHGALHSVPAETFGTLYFAIDHPLRIEFKDDVIMIEGGGLCAFPLGHAHRVGCFYEGDAGKTVGPPETWRTTDSAPSELTGIGFHRVMCLSSRYTELLFPQLVPPCLVLPPQTVAETPGLHAMLECLALPEVYADPEQAFLRGRVASTIAAIMITRALRLAKDEGRNLLKGLGDSRIRKAVQAIRKDPARRWTLDSMALEAMLSRNSFAIRFKSAVGETPASFLARFRLTLASEYLAAHEWPVGAIAERVGYQSEQAFSKAFRRHFGLSPGRYRTAVRSGQITAETSMVDLLEGEEDP